MIRANAFVYIMSKSPDWSFSSSLPHHNPSPTHCALKEPCSFCNRCTYCLDTVFQAAMYFSMQDEKQVCSPLEREDEGFGTQRSKQCSFIFYNGCKLIDPQLCVFLEYLY